MSGRRAPAAPRVGPVGRAVPVAVTLLGALLVALTPAVARAEGEEIVAIDVEDNTKTSDETILLIADVEKGDVFTYDLVERIKIDLVSSGLFKDVQVFSTPYGKGVKLTIVAKEKHSWVVGPTFYNQPGNIGGGLGFGEANLFGENKKLLLYGQLATADSLFFAVYLDPQIRGTPLYWRIDVYLRHAVVSEYEAVTRMDVQPDVARIAEMNYLNGGLLLGFKPHKQVSLDARVRGAYVYFRDVRWAERLERTDVPPPPQEDGWDVSAEVRLSRDARANWHGVTTGTMAALTFEHALPALGSDVSYWILTSRFAAGFRFFEEHNLILKAGAAMGDELPFQQEFTAGGAPGLRGYKTWQFRGDTKLGGTVEYSFPMFKVGPFAFRGIGFWDTAFTTFLREEGVVGRSYLPGQTTTSAAQWRNGVGLGFRTYVRSVVLPLVGVDVGFAPEVGDYHVYLALGLVEL